MTDPIFDHDKLDVYRLAVEYSAFECAAIQDVLVASGGFDTERSREAKKMLKRIVSMLTQLTKKKEGMGDMPTWSDAGVDYEHEHRCAEHESHGA